MSPRHKMRLRCRLSMHHWDAGRQCGPLRGFANGLWVRVRHECIDCDAVLIREERALPTYGFPLRGWQPSEPPNPSPPPPPPPFQPDLDLIGYIEKGQNPPAPPYGFPLRGWQPSEPPNPSPPPPPPPPFAPDRYIERGQ